MSSSSSHRSSTVSSDRSSKSPLQGCGRPSWSSLTWLGMERRSSSRSASRGYHRRWFADRGRQSTSAACWGDWSWGLSRIQNACWIGRRAAWCWRCTGKRFRGRWQYRASPSWGGRIAPSLQLPSNWTRLGSAGCQWCWGLDLLPLLRRDPEDRRKTLSGIGWRCLAGYSWQEPDCYSSLSPRWLVRTAAQPRTSTLLAGEGWPPISWFEGSKLSSDHLRDQRKGTLSASRKPRSWLAKCSSRITFLLI